jgi:hypothetical protein
VSNLLSAACCLVEQRMAALRASGDDRRVHVVEFCGGAG